MAERKSEYSIYGSAPGTGSGPQSPPGGSQQPTELREIDSLEAQVEHILQRLDITYPIRSRKEFLDAVVADVPGVCDLGHKTLSLRDLIFNLMETDFPIGSGHEAATLLAASCPIPAQAAG